ncbi:MAG TPA: NADPH:quinone reductase [Polyangiaceae bacterium]|jgi:NADPH2:quinone reductase
MKMKAIRVRQFGGPEVLVLEEVDVPELGEKQVLVRVHAAGVNPADTYARSGGGSAKPELPYTPGSDAAGVVEAVSPGVLHVKPGDRVYTARTISGAYAELALASAKQVHPLPERVSFEQGAGLYVPYGTAYRALRQIAHVRAGESALVHGASGGVGIAALQFGRAMGLTLLGTAGSEKGRELAKREGAHHVFDHHDPKYRDAILAATNGRGVDVILEMLADVNLGHDLQMLAPRGRVVVIGSRGDVTLTPRDLMTRDASIHGMLLWNVPEVDEIEIHAVLATGLEEGVLRPVVGKELPLAEAARAHREILEPGAYGKIVLIP